MSSVEPNKSNEIHKTVEICKNVLVMRVDDLTSDWQKYVIDFDPPAPGPLRLVVWLKDHKNEHPSNKTDDPDATIVAETPEKETSYKAKGIRLLPKRYDPKNYDTDGRFAPQVDPIPVLDWGITQAVPVFPPIESFPKNIDEP
ncbi:hypothetical protein HYDPIDRAFT_34837 [Hydnomerulius pinastri MD-312]|uniref:Uncharacterized protein n=1 Tax=Hydnomerulius pinastri MD-312 TaxID=994086 RepID=A0A0C9W6H7_9AGAM|nr:hypothetical protein HYDPIDRAFT_34837 [Hydnomerulius pinastri MD-312]